MTQKSPLVLQKVDRRERRGVMAALDLSQCLLWFDENGLIVDGNANVQALLATDFGTLRTMTHADLMREPDPTQRRYRTQWARIRDGLLRNEEASVFSRNGTEIWSSVSYAAIRNDAGRTRRVLAIIIDLSPWSWRPREFVTSLDEHL